MLRFIVNDLSAFHIEAYLSSPAILFWILFTVLSRGDGKSKTGGYFRSRWSMQTVPVNKEILPTWAEFSRSNVSVNTSEGKRRFKKCFQEKTKKSQTFIVEAQVFKRVRGEWTDYCRVQNFGDTFRYSFGCDDESALMREVANESQKQINRLDSAEKWRRWRKKRLANVLH